MVNNILDILFYTQKGHIFLSILWGFGLAILFRKACDKKSCIIYKAPVPNNIVSNVYTVDGKCYRFYTHTTKCTSNTIN